MDVGGAVFKRRNKICSDNSSADGPEAKGIFVFIIVELAKKFGEGGLSGGSSVALESYVTQ